MYLLRPKLWYGAEPQAIGRLAFRTKLSIAPARSPALGLGLALSLVNGGFAAATHLVFARRIAETKIAAPPIFVLGHWRSGTTLLHELLCQDDRLTAPNGYQCFVPGHFLLTEPLLKPLLGKLLPKTRPMDGMSLDLSLPQEDEFALLNRTGLSVGADFFNPVWRPDAVAGQLNLSGLSPTQLQLWQDAWIWFLKSVLVANGPNRRLALKSPNHTARVATICKLFPEARFIHISRAPRHLLASTERTWRCMIDSHALKPATKSQDVLSRRVAENFDEIYSAYRQDRTLIPDGHLVEISYENLVAAPVDVMQRIYKDLSLGAFDPVRDRIERRMQTSPGSGHQHDYATRPMPGAMALSRNVSWYADAFGYSEDVTVSEAPGQAV